MSITVLLLAAGGSTRMRGADKLLETLEGEPLLRRSARTALASHAQETLVVLGANQSARRVALEGLPIRIVLNENWQGGMGCSIAAGAAAVARETRGVMVMPADMPDLTPALLNRLIDAMPMDAPQMILRPQTMQGKPGNPVLFGADHIPALSALDGDEGARALLARHRDSIRFIDTGGTAILTDLDTAQAWATYRDGHKC